jgi:hypothetical protein
MGPRKRVSGVTQADANRAKEPRERALWRDWLPSLLTAAVAGGIALYGTNLGSKTAGDAQLKLEQQRNVHADEQQRQRDQRADAQQLLDKAEEIVTLVEKTVVTNSQVTQSILAMPYTPNHMATIPDDPERVTALVTLYFPGAVDDARVYEAKCAEHIVAVQETLMARLQGKPTSDKDNQIYQDALSAGDRVIYDVMAAVGKRYKARTPLSPAEVRKMAHPH